MNHMVTCWKAIALLVVWTHVTEIQAIFHGLTNYNVMSHAITSKIPLKTLA